MDYREWQTRAHSDFISSGRNRVATIRTTKMSVDNLSNLDHDATTEVDKLQHGYNSDVDHQSPADTFRCASNSRCDVVNYRTVHTGVENGLPKNHRPSYEDFNNTFEDYYHSRLDRPRSLNPENVQVYNLPQKSGISRKDAIHRSVSLSPSIELSGHQRIMGHRDYSVELTEPKLDHCPPVTQSLSVNNGDSVQCRLIGPPDKHFHSYTPDKNDGMMDNDEDDGAINLSTAVKNPAINGDITATASIENGHTSRGSETTSSHFSRKFPDTPSLALSSSKRRHRPPSGSSPAGDRESPVVNGGAQTVLMLAAQHGLSPQQVQQLMQTQQGTQSQQLSQLMQHQSLAIQHQVQQKAQEQLLAQLNEQLQLNVLQQSQLLQQETKASCTTQQQQLQGLVVQQQQLVQQIQQIQLQQRQFILACLMQPFTSPQGMVSPGEMQQLWKEATSPLGSTDDHKAGHNGLPATNPLLAGSVLALNGMVADSMSFTGPLIGQPPVAVKTEDGANPLYRHGLCKWPGCDTQCDDIHTFTKHLNDEHTLDDRNTAQARVQMQVVTQLEIQLAREKELLHAMMQHLHFKPQRDRDCEERHNSDMKSMSSAMTSSSAGSPVKSTMAPVSLPSPPTLAAPPSGPPHMPGLPPLAIPSPGTLTSLGKLVTPQSRPSSQPQTPTGLGPIRRRVSDKCNLPVSAEIQRNREFYKNTDVRPPFTYASLIRQAIIESQNRQLTLNEVYQWFQNTFAYFRRNEATWKNAVRHNLSLHKCFMRVENVKGAVWTVDEIEFYKRRPQKLSGSLSNSASMTPVDHGSYMYGDPLSTSLTALDQSSMLINQHFSNGSLSSEGCAEDLSMKSHNNSNDSFSASKSNSPTREDMSVFMLKSETAGFQDDLTNGSSPKSRHSLQGLDLSPRSQQQLSPFTARLSPQGRHLSPTSEKSPSMAYSNTDERPDENMDVNIPSFTERKSAFPDKHYSDSGAEAVGGTLNMQIKGKTFSQSEALNNISVNQSGVLCMTREEELIREAHMAREMALARAQEAELVKHEDLIRAQEAEFVRQDELSRVREMAEFHEEQMSRERGNVSEAELAMNREELHIREAELARKREELMKSSNQTSPLSQDDLQSMQPVSVSQELYSPLMHTNNLMTVPHSIS